MKKKILIFNPKVTAGGISKILSEYINNFNDDIDVQIMTFEIVNEIYFRDKKNIIHVIGATKNLFKRVYREYKLFKKGNFDVIHINGDYVSRVFECLIAKIAGIKKIIIHSHNNGVGNNKKIKVFIHNILKKMFDFLATDYLACSQNAAKWMFSKKIIKNNKYLVVNNGIDVDKFKFNNDIRVKIRKKYNLENKIVFGAVGRLTYQKNPLFMIDVFYEFRKKNKESVFLFIGEGELKEKVQEKIKLLDLENYVKFLGNIENVFEFYNAMDCFLFPSVYEGLGIVAIEAQTSGILTLVSDRVPIETNISQVIRYLPLENGPKNWANTIKQNIIPLNVRQNVYKEIINNSYDIKSSAEKIQNIYLK